DVLRDEAYLAVGHDRESAALALVRRRDELLAGALRRHAADRPAAAGQPAGAVGRRHLDHRDRLVRAVRDVGQLRLAVVAEDAALLVASLVVRRVAADAADADEVRRRHPHRLATYVE